MFQKREKKTRQNRATNERHTNKDNDDTKFSYLERVHALPVLVQVVHEIHDDDVKKKRISAAECAKILCEKMGCQMKRHIFLHFICVLCEK